MPTERDPAISVRCDPDLYDQVRAAAIQADRSVANYVRWALRKQIRDSVVVTEVTDRILADVSKANDK